MDAGSPVLLNPSEEEQARDVWNACLEMIRDSVNTQSFKTWFEPMVPVSLRGGKLTVQVPSQFFYDWLEEHYYSVISATIEKVLGKEAHLEYSVRTDEAPVEVEYQTSPQAGALQERRLFPPQPPSFTATTHAGRSGAEVASGTFQTFLNARYTFENFIKGDSNQLARAGKSVV